MVVVAWKMVVVGLSLSLNSVRIGLLITEVTSRKMDVTTRPPSSSTVDEASGQPILYKMIAVALTLLRRADDRVQVKEVTKEGIVLLRAGVVDASLAAAIIQSTCASLMCNTLLTTRILPSQLNRRSTCGSPD